MTCVLQEPSQQAYTPQVEAISPTLPTDGVAEDANFRSTKDDLLQQISKVDREISKVEGSIAKLKKKEVKSFSMKIGNRRDYDNQ